jgi:hypothetical protein
MLISIRILFRSQDCLGQRMVQDLREAVRTALKRVAMDRRRLLGRKQTRRLQRAPGDDDLLLRYASLLRRLDLLSLSRELLGGGIASEAEAAHKFQGNGGALVRSHLFVEGRGVGLVEWRLHVLAPSWF